MVAINKMRILPFVFIFFITFNAAAQKEVLDGKAYRSVHYLQQDNAFISGTFLLKKSYREIDNAYKLKSVSGGVPRNEMLYGIWIIDCEEYFYLNIYRYAYGFPKCFIKFEKKGKYYYFKAPPLNSASQQLRIANSQLMFGLIGSGITSTLIDRHNANRWHCVLNFSTGTVRILTEDYITELLANYPNLYKEFSNEIKKSSIKTLKQYLEKINQEFID